MTSLRPPSNILLFSTGRLSPSIRWSTKAESEATCQENTRTEDQTAEPWGEFCLRSTTRFLTVVRHSCWKTGHIRNVYRQSKCSAMRMKNEFAGKDVSNVLTRKLWVNFCQFLDRTVEFQCGMQHRFIVDTGSYESIVHKGVPRVKYTCQTNYRADTCYHWSPSYVARWSDHFGAVGVWMCLRSFLGLFWNWMSCMIWMSKLHFGWIQIPSPPSQYFTDW